MSNFVTETMDKNRPDSGFFTKIWKFFTSVKLTVVVLILIASTSIVGTLIPQNASPAFYFHKYGETLFRIFSALDVFDMYHSWWFLALIILLAVSIVVCSIDRLKLTWKTIFPKTISYNANRFRKLKNRTHFVVEGGRNPDNSVIPAYKAYLEKKFGHVDSQKTENGYTLYAEKGRWTKLGVYVVHISILFLLFGGMIGIFFGFKGNMRLNEGEKSNTVHIKKRQSPEKLAFFLRCNDFHVEFYDTGMPEEFRTNLSVIKDGKEVVTRDIIVNKPLRYQGINIYQSSYGTAAADNVSLEIVSRSSGMVYEKTAEIGRSIKVPEGGGQFTLTGFNPDFSFRGHRIGQVFTGTLDKEGGGEKQVVMPVEFPSFDKMRGGDFVFQVQDFEKTYYTGLQITKDPGVVYVYIGFVLMIAGCFIAFLMHHQRVLVEVTAGENNRHDVFVSGIADRNSQGMKLKVEKIATKLEETTRS